MSTTNGGAAGLSTDELRAAVRAVLQDVLPASVIAPRTVEGAAQQVSLRTDAELDAFVRRVAALCDDPGQRSAIKDGRRRFTLAAGQADGPAQPASTQPGPTQAATCPVVRIDRGAVTERTVKKAAADGARLVVGPRAVLTPLARDRARSLGVQVEREER
jgi:hypothetical protein